MKFNKFILTALTMLVGGLGVGLAEEYNTPRMDSPQGFATANYGGVNYSTSSLSSAAVFVGAGNAVVQGVIFSTGTAADYVVFYDTDTTGTPNADREVFRLYNTVYSTAGAGSAGALTFSGPNLLDYPVRMKKGLAWKPSTAIYNMITVLYYLRQ